VKKSKKNVELRRRTGGALDVKGAVSSIFSITVKGQKTHFYLWKHKNNGAVVLKWVFQQYMETIISVSGEGWPGWKWRLT